MRDRQAYVQALRHTQTERKRKRETETDVVAERALSGLECRLHVDLINNLDKRERGERERERERGGGGGGEGVKERARSRTQNLSLARMHFIDSLWACTNERIME